MADSQKIWYWDLGTGTVKGSSHGSRCTEESIEHWTRFIFFKFKVFRVLHAQILSIGQFGFRNRVDKTKIILLYSPTDEAPQDFLRNLPLIQIVSILG